MTRGRPQVGQTRESGVRPGNAVTDFQNRGIEQAVGYASAEFGRRV